jgi:hypothetical protein
MKTNNDIRNKFSFASNLLAMVEMFDDPKQNRGFRSCPK